ncbi:unnamed protein product [Lampetra planeri]
MTTPIAATTTVTTTMTVARNDDRDDDDDSANGGHEDDVHDDDDDSHDNHGDDDDDCHNDDDDDRNDNSHNSHNNDDDDHQDLVPDENQPLCSTVPSVREQSRDSGTVARERDQTSRTPALRRRSPFFRGGNRTRVRKFGGQRPSRTSVPTASRSRSTPLAASRV